MPMDELKISFTSQAGPGMQLDADVVSEFYWFRYKNNLVVSSSFKKGLRLNIILTYK